MDLQACNYLPAAEFSDGSCEYISCLDECGVLNGDNSSCTDQCGVVNGDDSCLDECGVPYGDNSSCSDCAGVPHGTAEDLGCGCGEPAAVVGYYCNGDVRPWQVGDSHAGGIVFYVDETGQHGLVAAAQNLESTYEWGCSGWDVSGASGTGLGTGYQNTMDIAAGCYTSDGGVSKTAAQAAIDHEAEGFSDWYLPSHGELIEIYNSIGPGSAKGNIAGLYGCHLSSTEKDYYNNQAYCSSGDYKYSSQWTKSLNQKVRVIRAF